MFNIAKENLDWGGTPLTLETGRMARQADGAVLATYGETCVLATVVAERTARPELDFFPLTVNYQEKTYAAGKIPGGYFKREGRPSEKETLVSRLIDRPIRPLFPKAFRNETQIIATVISHDLENDPDIVAMVATSAALRLSGIPFLGPVGAARVGYKDGEYLLNPALEQLGESALNLVVAGTKDAVLMVESQAAELSEEVMLGAVMFGHKQFQPVIESIDRLGAQAARPARPLPEPVEAPALKQLPGIVTADLEAAFADADKQARQEKLAAARDKMTSELITDATSVEEKAALQDAFHALESKIMREKVLTSQTRVDGRTLTDIRPISCEVGVLPRAHGSALFTRGETQALVVTTLGTGDDEQFVDALEGTTRESFLLHYNFPPYSVGEVGRVGFTGRREIGHGKLAWRALKAVLPSKDDFPYTLRVVSEITESNGSSSMATVCGSSLSLMDAAVPLRAPVAGIAMGLIKEEDRVAVLSDILGDEDHLGDMDFKVAGTAVGITSLQMDIKVTGITEAIMAQALAQAKDGRVHILGEMAKAIDTARSDLRAHAPRIETIKIPQDKIRDVIGSGGKVVREIVETSGAKIDIGEDGTIKVAANNDEAIASAMGQIKAITASPEVGEIYDGKVVKCMDFGAFVNFFGKTDGLVHISQLAPHRVERVTDIVKEGDMVKVKFLGFDDRGKVRLTMKNIDQGSGKEQPPPRSVETA